MEHNSKSIRTFIGAKNFEISRSFYRDLGFTENIISHNMSYFETNNMGFYLQDAYVEDWINNTMVFMEMDDVNHFWKELIKLELTSKYDVVKLVPVRELDWGKECFVYDPSGVLWHFGEFKIT
jgi:hypothetical protein